MQRCLQPVGHRSPGINNKLGRSHGGARPHQRGLQIDRRPQQARTQWTDVRTGPVDAVSRRDHGLVDVTQRYIGRINGFSSSRIPDNAGDRGYGLMKLGGAGQLPDRYSRVRDLIDQFVEVDVSDLC